MPEEPKPFTDAEIAEYRNSIAAQLFPSLFKISLERFLATIKVRDARIKELEETLRLYSRSDDVKALLAGIEDLKNGRVISFDELEAKLDGKLDYCRNCELKTVELSRVTAERDALLNLIDSHKLRDLAGFLFANYDSMIWYVKHLESIASAVDKAREAQGK